MSSAWPRVGEFRVVLAPMEGVTDAPMRETLTDLGGFDFCVSEFLRVSQDPLPEWVIRREVPELDRPGAVTRAGVPVGVQLLGGDPGRLAESARRAIAAGARLVDLNFGCPAPTVNRHDGGATLLKHPARIREIVEAVRRAVPAEFPVSAKLRLGWDRLDAIHENAERAAEGGASWITIHGRTRVAGYVPPAYWLPIGEVRARLEPAGIPVVANGEIWTTADFARCREETGCTAFMIGRGALADPWLARRMRGETGLPDRARLPWAEFLAERAPWASDRRLKQWLRQGKGAGTLSAEAWDRAKVGESRDAVLAALTETRVPARASAGARPPG